MSSGETKKKRKEGEEIVVQGLPMILCGVCPSAWTEFYFLYFVSQKIEAKDDVISTG